MSNQQSNHPSSQRPGPARPQAAGVVAGLATVLAALAVLLVVERHAVGTGVLVAVVAVMGALLVGMGVVIGSAGRGR